MQNALEVARRHLLEPGGLNESSIERVLGSMLNSHIDNADLYFQSIRHEAWILEDGIIKEGDYASRAGVGLRALCGEKTGFAYSDDLSLLALEEASIAARSIAIQGGGQIAMQPWRPATPVIARYAADNPLLSLGNSEKIALMHQVEQLARKLDPRIQQVIVSLGGNFEVVMVVASDGTMSADVRPLVRLSVTVIVEDKGRREQGNCSGGGRGNYQMFLKDDTALAYAAEAVRQALINLESVPAPAGTMPVVLGPGWPGILLHEAVGHGLEGDFNRRGSSAFSGRLGERVATPLCTVVDDGTLMGRRGSLTVDDEGTPSQCTVLIENGILKGYLQDKLNARLMNMAPTGNGRRESYAHLPLPRMTNTYMLAGPHEKEDIIASVEKGLYAVSFGGGQVDITSGKFVFSASEAYLIENGKITRPVKGATLIGNGPEVLTKVSMVGNDLALDRGIGVCGKEGQSVPVGVGQPTLRIDALTVGGTQA